MHARGGSLNGHPSSSPQHPPGINIGCPLAIFLAESSHLIQKGAASRSLSASGMTIQQ